VRHTLSLRTSPSPQFTSHSHISRQQYQYTFAEKTDWSAYYAPRDEILAYIESVVDKYKLMPYIHLEHEMLSARYDEPTGKWHVHIKRPLPLPPTESERDAEVKYEEFEDTADLLFTGVGGLSRWSWPEIDGLKEFKGLMVHSAGWEVPRPPDGAQTDDGSVAATMRNGWEEDVKDWGNKRVAVIGVVRTLHLPRCSASLTILHHSRARPPSRSYPPSNHAWRRWRTTCAGKRGSPFRSQATKWLRCSRAIRDPRIVRVSLSWCLFLALTRYRHVHGGREEVIRRSGVLQAVQTGPRE
jgi:hypothetical protein